MKKIAVSLSIGFANAIREDILDVDDDLTEKEIAECVEDWANDYIQLAWEEIEE